MAHIRGGIDSGWRVFEMVAQENPQPHTILLERSGWEKRVRPLFFTEEHLDARVGARTLIRTLDDAILRTAGTPFDAVRPPPTSKAARDDDDRMQFGAWPYRRCRWSWSHTEISYRRRAGGPT